MKAGNMYVARAEVCKFLQEVPSVERTSLMAQGPVSLLSEVTLMEEWSGSQECRELIGQVAGHLKSGLTHSL